VLLSFLLFFFGKIVIAVNQAITITGKKKSTNTIGNIHRKSTKNRSNSIAIARLLKENGERKKNAHQLPKIKQIKKQIK